MNALRFALAILFLGAAFNCNAQDIEELPETATGARALPHVTVNIGVFGFYWGSWVEGSTYDYVWGKAGGAIDDMLDDMGIDITSDSGVLQYSVLFEVLNRQPVTITGEIDKLVDESLKEAMQRNYGEGHLSDNFLGSAPAGSGTGINYFGGTNYGATDSGGNYVIINIDYTSTFSCSASGCTLTVTILGIHLYNSNGTSYVGPDYGSLVQQPTGEVGGY